VEAAAELVVHPTHRHPVERQSDHLQSVFVIEALRHAQQQAQLGRVRELGLGTEAALARVEGPAELPGHLAQQRRVEVARRGFQTQEVAQVLGDYLRGLLHLVAAVLPPVDDREQHAAEAGHVAAVALVGREVGAAEEGLKVGREEDRHGPAAVAGRALDEGHVNLVEVGALLAVHLDADEVFVEDAADLGVLEALVLHDVAPVARRVADAEEDGPFQGAGAGQRLVAPGEPVHGVVGVLAEVGAGFLREPVGELRRLRHGGLRDGCLMASGAASARRFRLMASGAASARRFRLHRRADAAPLAISETVSKQCSRERFS